MKILASIFFLLFFCIIHVFSQINKEDVYEQLIKKYGNINDISLKFKSPDLNLSGYLNAKSGNKYRIVFPDRQLISNGKTIWNFVPKDSKVIISSLDDLNKEHASIENIFFGFINNYSPTDIIKEQSSKTGSGYILTLQQKAMASSLAKIKSLKLWIDTKAFTIKQIQIETDIDTQKWEIEKLIVNSNIKDSQFDFDVPKDVEVIDLR